jgi:serine/threonine-protein kinase PpkA
MSKFPTIPGYKITKKLGQGGMATVYLAIQENLNRLVAIKLLDLDKIDNLRLSKRFIKEAKALSKLSHQNIVSIYDIGKYKNYYYIVMEYLAKSLKDRLNKDTKLNPTKALYIIQSISDALFYAHTNGVVHRDIKPDNIMFRENGSPVLLDFGIAKYIDAKTRLTKTGVSIGTPQYMSPEQCNAEKLDGRSDIYSLGVVLYEMLSGKIPYTANDIFGIAMKHLKEPVPILKGKLKTYQYLIDRMMNKDKKKRIKTKKELFQIIKDLLNSENTEYKTTKPDIQKKRKTNTSTTVKTIHRGKKIAPPKATQKKVFKKKKKEKKLLWYSLGFTIIAILILIIILSDNPIKDKITHYIKFIESLLTESKAQ